MSNCLQTTLQTNFIQSSGKFRKILAYIQEACRLSTMTFEMSTFCALGFVSLFGHFPSYGKLNFIWLQVNCSNKRDLSFVCVFVCFFWLVSCAFFCFCICTYAVDPHSMISSKKGTNILFFINTRLLQPGEKSVI